YTMCVCVLNFRLSLGSPFGTITQTLETSIIYVPVARLTGNAPGLIRSNLYVFRQSWAFARHQTQSSWTRISSSDTGAVESDTSRTRGSRRHRQRTNGNR